VHGFRCNEDRVFKGALYREVMGVFLKRGAMSAGKY
jgi:hypothetical protein